MGNVQISFMEKNDIQESANVLSVAMLDNPLHVAVFQGKGEKERMEIEKMFCRLLSDLPGITFLARINRQIAGVMRMKTCNGSKVSNEHAQTEGVTNLDWRKSYWHNEWARHDPLDQHWHVGPVGVLPSHQGKGIGSKLLSRFCQEVDACLQSTQTLGPILDGAMRNTPEGREFVRVSMEEGVKAAVIKRDGPFDDYSQGPLEDQPRIRSELY